MLSHLANSFSRLAVRPIAGPSSLRLPLLSSTAQSSTGSSSDGDLFSSSTAGVATASRRRASSFISSPLAGSPAYASSSSSPFNSQAGQVRHASQLAPKRTKHRKAHKGHVPLHIGGSLKGTTLSHGTYGIRLLAPARLSAKQLQSAEAALKRKLRVIKGAQVYLRTFPDIAVCAKGNETRMGKGKGTFQFWAARATIGKVVFEIGGPVEIRPEVAREALRLAAAKLPVKTEFVTRDSAPRLGNLVETGLPPGATATQGREQAKTLIGAPVQTSSPLASSTGVPSISSASTTAPASS